MRSRYLGHLEVPIQRVHIELTNACDFDCVFCPKSVMERPYGFMKTELAKSLITELTEKEVCEKITFHVMGEPTLHPDFFEILDHAKDIKANIGLTTNGGGLGKKIGERLAQYDLYQIDISIQTPDEKSYSMRNAGELPYKDYIKGILDFFGEYMKHGRKTRFKFRFMNTRFRPRGLEESRGEIKMMSTSEELRATFNSWVGQIYDILDVEKYKREKVLGRLKDLVSYKWNVVEIYPNVFFETYVLKEWGNAFDYDKIRGANKGYCLGMRDHFAILQNGDVTLCCIDYEGRSKIGNLYKASLEKILGTDELGRILEGFKKNILVHPHCKKCLGSRTRLGSLTKPKIDYLTMNLLKPFFYKQTKIY